MAAKLVAEEGLLKGLVLSLEDGNQWIIGRDPDACQLLIEDPSASRKHLICRITPEGIIAENLSATNPTQINDEEIKKPRLLQNGDAVKIGDGVFRFYAEAAAHLFDENSQDIVTTLNPSINGDLKKTHETIHPETNENEPLDDENIESPMKLDASPIADEQLDNDTSLDDPVQDSDLSFSENTSTEESEKGESSFFDSEPSEDELSSYAPHSEENTPNSSSENSNGEASEENLEEKPEDENLENKNPEEIAPLSEEGDQNLAENTETSSPSLVENDQPFEQVEEDKEPINSSNDEASLGLEEIEPDHEIDNDNEIASENQDSSPLSDENSSLEEIAAKQPAVEDLLPLSPEEKKPQDVSQAVAPQQIDSEEDDDHEDTIYEDGFLEKNGGLAEINFGILDTGRWLLKVIGGPNNGAEFSMQTGSTYVIGTDPNACDVVFYDTSVSRQHARISVGQDDSLIIEDLKSRNGTSVDGQRITGKQPLPTNILVTLGTTSFVVFDREGEMQTIISPLMPSIVKELKKEEAEKEAAAPTTPTAPPAPPEPPPPTAAELAIAAEHERNHKSTTLAAYILIGILTGLFVLVGIGTSTLFRSDPVVSTDTVDPYKALDAAFASFPNVKYTFNKNTGQLQLVGHVLSSSDRSQLLYTLQGLSFIRNMDDSGIVIDEYVWREINQVIEKNPDWKGISVMASSPGHFIVTGYLKTHSQAERLTEYLNANFPYPDLLDKRVVVDEDILTAVNNVLDSYNFRNVTSKLDNGDVILSGGTPLGKSADMGTIISKIKEIRGVRSVRNLTTEIAAEASMVNISDKYDVTGFSTQGGNMNVVINGRILMKGDMLDGMTITKIQSSSIFLQKGSTQYRIDFTR